MADRLVGLDRQADGVAVVRLNRPKMNALSMALLGELTHLARELCSDPPGAVVVWGGERTFAAGAEISEFGGVEEATQIASAFAEALEAVAAIPRAVIAAVTGYALGGGCELALACDFRVAADDARLGQPEILLGIIPGGGGTQRLPRLIGPARAKELILTGRHVGAEEALAIGLVDRLVPAATAFDAARRWAAELASGPVVAHGLAKRAVDEGLQGTLPEGLNLERRLFAQVFETDDAAAGIRSFLERGPGRATFGGR